MKDFLAIDLVIKNGLLELNLDIPSIGLKIVADTYYFALDNSTEYDDEGEKVVAVFAAILTQWVFQIENLKQGSICFLPIDFSDQYVGCFRFEAADSYLSGVYGYTEKITGWMINPSKLSQFDIHDSDFTKNSTYFSVLRTDLLSSIEDCIKKIKL